MEVRLVVGGSYFVNFDSAVDAVIEVPHPRFDINTLQIGARVFQQSEAQAFLMAGAHRHSNGLGTADVAHLDESIFQEVHEVFTGSAAENSAWSIHGYAAANHSFPSGTAAVSSNGDGGVSEEIVNLAQMFDDEGFLSFAFNTLPASDPLNVQFNGSEEGGTFSSLGGTTNEQGRFTRSLGGLFVQIEMEQSIRFDADNRLVAAALIAETIGLTGAPDGSGGVPEPSALVLMSLGLTLGLTWRRRQAS